MCDSVVKVHLAWVHYSIIIKSIKGKYPPNNSCYGPLSAHKECSDTAVRQQGERNKTDEGGETEIASACRHKQLWMRPGEAFKMTLCSFCLHRARLKASLFSLFVIIVKNVLVLTMTFQSSKTIFRSCAFTETTSRETFSIISTRKVLLIHKCLLTYFT